MLRTAALLLAACLAGAAETELVLADGTRMRGTILEERDASVVMNVLSVVRGQIRRTTISIANDRIASRLDLRPVAEELPERERALDGTPAAWFQLAQWLLDRGEVDAAVARVRSGLELDPGAQRGRRLMEQAGMILVDGRWVREQDHLAATGQVRYGREVMTATAAASRRQLDAAIRERDLAKTNVDRLTPLASGNAALVAATEAELAKVTQQREAAQKRLDRAVARAEATGRPAAQQPGVIQAQREVAQADAAVTTATANVTKAKEAQAAVETHKRQLAAAKAALAKAEREVAALSGSATAAPAAPAK